MVRAVFSVSLVTAVVLGILTWSTELVPVSADEQFWYRNEKTDKCLDGTDDGKVILSSCNTGWTQTWMLYDGTQLQNLRSGGCLEMSPNGNLFTRQCDPKNLFQEWKTYLPHILRNYGTNLCVNYKLRGVGCIYTSKEQIWDRG